MRGPLALGLVLLSVPSLAADKAAYCAANAKSWDAVKPSSIEVRSVAIRFSRNTEFDLTISMKNMTSSHQVLTVKGEVTALDCEDRTAKKCERIGQAPVEPSFFGIPAGEVRGLRMTLNFDNMATVQNELVFKFTPSSIKAVPSSLASEYLVDSFIHDCSK